MNQKELKNFINKIYVHATSIKEDMEYGLKARQEIKVTDQEEKELNQISDKLMLIGEKIGMQFIIQDFE